MLHLALVQNLLSAIGAAPHFARPNLPAPAEHYPAGVPLALLPFGEPALRHFMFLERPEGMDARRRRGPRRARGGRAASAEAEGESCRGCRTSPRSGTSTARSRPASRTWRTKYGEGRLFVGPPRAQATAAHFRWPELVAVTDLASAQRAIDTILEQGEGAAGEWRDAHFGQFVAILDEYLAAQGGRPRLRPGAAGLAGERAPRRARRRRAADHRSGHGPLRGPVQRRLRGAAAGAASATSRTPRRPTPSWPCWPTSTSV